jgi:hypothetical protein
MISEAISEHCATVNGSVMVSKLWQVEGLSFAKTRLIAATRAKKFGGAEASPRTTDAMDAEGGGGGSQEYRVVGSPRAQS